MQDNFNIHSWKLNQAINELENRQCPDCGCKMEGTMCNECGYMEEATFTGKHDDNPELKGGQKKLPDELQAQILNKEAVTPLADLYDLVSNLVAQGISKDEILRIVNFATADSMNENESNLTPLQQYIYDYEVEISGDDFASKELENIKKLNSIEDVVKYYGGYRGWAVDKDLKPELTSLFKALKAKFPGFISTVKLNEGEDHEVSMAQASLKAIVSAASQLMSKVGDDERNIPGWIQDHITNAENYIEQANQGFHELEPAVKDVDVDALDMVAEGVSDDLKTKAKNALAIHLRSAMADKNQDHIEEIKDARDRINNAKSVDELANILGEFGYEDDEIEDILG